MLQEPIQQMKSAIDNASKICLFGIGALLMECYDQLVLSIGRAPDMLCDNASEKWGKEYSGKTCISPAELASQRDGIVVIITVRKYEDIYQQLRKMGIQDIFTARYDSGYYALRGINRLGDNKLPACDQVTANIDLKGRWTLVTGASRGIGRQIALAMAKLGSNIIAHSRSVAHAAEVIQVCSEYGVQAVPIAAELGNISEVEEMLAKLHQMAVPIDIVFNNAAVHKSSPWPSDIWSSDIKLYEDCFRVNTIAPALICQALIPPMIKRGFGRVVSIHTNLQYEPQEIAYICSKTALDRFVHDMSTKLVGTGVAMTLADPGWVRTDAGSSAAPNAVESVIPGIMLGAILDSSFNGCRFSAQDYAGLTLYKACQRAKQIYHEQPSIRWI